MTIRLPSVSGDITGDFFASAAPQHPAHLRHWYPGGNPFCKPATEKV
ncbi:hypothetical protein EZR04_005087 [Escherichia coli]|nr:hypothetical protein [Escherichia coli]EIG4040543.1 hypothetical protein [Escherichia coli]